MTDDELDHVQWDLESMLTSIIIRKNTVKEELRTFAKTMQFGRSQHRTSKNSKFPTIVSICFIVFIIFIFYFVDIIFHFI